MKNGSLIVPNEAEHPAVEPLGLERSTNNGRQLVTCNTSRSGV
jgi:hypothetical protein